MKILINLTIDPSYHLSHSRKKLLNALGALGIIVTSLDSVATGDGCGVINVSLSTLAASPAADSTGFREQRAIYASGVSSCNKQTKTAVILSQPRPPI